MTFTKEWNLFECSKERFIFSLKILEQENLANRFMFSRLWMHGFKRLHYANGATISKRRKYISQEYFPIQSPKFASPWIRDVLGVIDV